jgi:microcystin-dependent protein
MKSIFTALATLLITAGVLAQVPEKMSYQAVIRDAQANLVTSRSVGLQISILEGSSSGNPVYIETHISTTNANGLLSIVIGEGSIVNGDFAAIDWPSGTYFIKTETDPNGGTAYTISGTSQLMSVPYAFHANTADSLTIPMPNQSLSISNDTIFLSNDGFIILPVVGPADAVENDLITYDGTNWVAKDVLIQSSGGGQSENNMQPWLGINHIIALVGIFPSRNQSDPFIAEIIMFGGNFAPRGWAFCDGQMLPISQYSALFSLLGTTYGGDGRTTFALPDLRSRTAIHPGTGPGLSSRRLGERGGSETNTMTIDQMPLHNHTITYQ